MTAVFDSALRLIGKTPLVELRRIHAGPGRIVAKVECLQPGGSVKDRAALLCIQLAYGQGRLAAGQPVVEMTSGNMGAALAVVCNIYGNPFHAVMSAGNSPERARMMRALGAELMLVPQVDGQPGMVTGADIAAASARAKELAAALDGYYVDQFNHPGVVLAHEQGTGPEICDALGSTPTAFVSVVGTGGTFLGVSQYLKSVSPTTVCAVVEPAGAEALARRPVIKSAHLLQGAGYGARPPQWRDGLADCFMNVSDDEALRYRELLARCESLHAGFTAAANVCAAVKLLESGQLSSDATVATVLCDTGLKY